MTDTAALAHEGASTLENAIETVADPSLAVAVQETFVSVTDATAAVRTALPVVAAALRAQADRREHVATAQALAEAHAEAHALAQRKVAVELRRLADRLDEPGAWEGVDRLVHELVSDLLLGALRLAHEGASPALTARAVAVGVLAGNDAIWTGAGPRLGCAYDYDSILALIRLSARAT